MQSKEQIDQGIAAARTASLEQASPTMDWIAPSR
jgi:hypothetical protein